MRGTKWWEEIATLFDVERNWVCCCGCALLYVCVYMCVQPTPCRKTMPGRGLEIFVSPGQKLKTIQQIIDFYLADGLFHLGYLHSKEIAPLVLFNALYPSYSPWTRFEHPVHTYMRLRVFPQTYILSSAYKLTVNWSATELLIH